MSSQRTDWKIVHNGMEVASGSADTYRRAALEANHYALLYLDKPMSNRVEIHIDHTLVLTLLSNPTNDSVPELQD